MAKSAKPKPSMNADTALAKLPKFTKDRNALFEKANRLKAAMQADAGDFSAHKKRMTEVYGLTREAIKIRDILTKCKDGVYEATVSQLYLLLDDIGRPFQLDMFPQEAGAQAAEPELPVDQDEAYAAKAAAADAQGAEEHPEGDEPTVAPKRRGRPPKAKGEPIENANKHLKKAAPPVDLSEAESEFEKARILAEKKRTPAQAMKAGAAESDEFLAKQVAKQKTPPRAPKPANDPFLDSAEPEGQGDYVVQ